MGRKVVAALDASDRHGSDPIPPGLLRLAMEMKLRAMFSWGRVVLICVIVLSCNFYDMTYLSNII